MSKWISVGEAIDKLINYLGVDLELSGEALESEPE